MNILLNLNDEPTKKSQLRLRILVASLAGTTIEFFDFYIYATAAVLAFPKLFFPTSDPTSGTLESLATFALAFFCPACRLGFVRAFRRQDRPQSNTGGFSHDDGAMHRSDRVASNLCFYRGCGTDITLSFSFRTGCRAWR